MTAGTGEYRIDPRCGRATNGWLLRRGDACSPAHWIFCIREPRPEWPLAKPQPYIRRNARTQRALRSAGNPAGIPEGVPS